MNEKEAEYASDHLYENALKIQGIAYLLMQFKDPNPPPEMNQFFRGVGLLLLDLGKESEQISSVLDRKV